MKYLKKFETEAEKTAWLISDEHVSPNVVLCSEHVEYDSKLRGVYIQHTNGKLYTTDAWSANGLSNGEANGVAVISEICGFVISKSTLGKVVWSNSTSLEEGIMVSSDVEVAKTDYAGLANTAIMAKVYPSAAKTCAEYTFPNGKKGYLPALGEWYEADKYRDEVNAAMSLIGGTAIGSHWSSTQYNDSRAWYFSGKGVAYPKNFSFVDIVRAFTTI